MKPITVDGMPAFEVLAEVPEGPLPETVMRVAAYTDTGFFRMSGRCVPNEADALCGLRGIVKIFRRR